MKKKPLIIAVLAVLILSLTYSGGAYASVDQSLQNSCAQALVNLKIIKGYEDGSLRLQNNIKRSEFVTMVDRLLGYDTDNDTANINMPFKDINSKHWSYNYFKIALKYKLIFGYPDNTIRSDKNVTYAEVLTVLIRSLGYESTLTGNWPDNVMKKASELGISKNVNLPSNKDLTRGEMSVLVYNSLTVSFKG